VIHVLAGLSLVAVGASLWTLGEYLMHRFAMHELRGKGLASREHLRHHAERDSILESWWFAWAGVLGVGAALALGAAQLLGAVGACLGIGWVAGYGFYDWIHFRAHRRDVAHPYERWVRRHHFHHHFGAPMRNHGVTIPFWDHVFGTFERPDRVRVPRRLALPWLVDADGEIHPEFRDDYVLVGAADPNERILKLDRARAFASMAPAD
jgi:sterol desaturase/sphingolipid hydroxylase (fatty acid hydroxylase superfamily)